jgi:oligoendopeptidase F
LNLPDTSAAFANATWADLEPFYDELAARELGAESAAEWLRDWSRFEELWNEAAARAHYDYTRDTTNSTLEEVNLRFSSAIEPLADERRVALASRLLDSGYSRPDMEEALRRFRTDRELFRAENVALRGELEVLGSQYSKTTGAMTVEWEGEEIPLPRLGPFVNSADREVRERAWRLQRSPYIDKHEELATLFSQQLDLRQRMARNAGFENFRDYMHREKHRFSYSVQDCLTFDDAVEEVMVPAAARILERRRQAMGLDGLRPWDTGCDPLGRPPLQPYASAEDLIERSGNVFGHVDPVLGERFRIMAAEGLLDLESRKGKAPGGYCTSFPHSRRPAIFMNAAGVANDVTVTLHESGHAFHAFEFFDTQELLWQWWPGMEMAEVGSMAMELLAAPYLGRDSGGFYSEEDYRRARIEHLEGILEFFPHCAAVDGFQQWIYTDPAAADPDARDEHWLQLRQRLEPGIDFDGLRDERVARWYMQGHIFQVPFYYIEYGIAQLGALQVWRNARKDQAGAVAAYRRALALGATRPLDELFRAAGVRLAFDRDTMRDLAEMVEEELDRLHA